MWWGCDSLFLHSAVASDMWAMAYGILLVWCVMGNAPFGQGDDQGLEGVLW